MNVPSTSHMGGIWERLIRTVHSVLCGLLEDHARQLHDEALRTLFTCKLGGHQRSWSPILLASLALGNLRGFPIWEFITILLPLVPCHGMVSEALIGNFVLTLALLFLTLAP